MKMIIILALLAFCGRSFAACEKIEYAEIKDMSKAELMQAYCDTNTYLLIEMKYNGGMMKLGRNTDDRKEQECREVEHKIERSYKRRFNNLSGLNKNNCTAW